MKWAISKKQLPVVLACVAVFIFAVFLYHARHKPTPGATYQPIAFQLDGEPHFILIWEIHGLFYHSTFPLSQVLPNDSSGKVRFSVASDQGRISIFPALLDEGFNSRGYSIGIIDRGVPRPPVEFRYSGENRITVARGLNWFLQVIQE